MIAAGAGRIVNIASTAGLKGYARVAAYCAAKHGVVGLTRALAAETARHGVTVNAVCPGYTEDTDMLRVGASRTSSRDRASREEDARAMLAKHSPRGDAHHAAGSRGDGGVALLARRLGDHRAGGRRRRRGGHVMIDRSRGISAGRSTAGWRPSRSTGPSARTRSRSSPTPS